MFCFAGICRRWRGTRGPKSAPLEGEHLLFSFLTCQANDVVRPIHPKALPVMLTTPTEFDNWLTAPTEEALAMQRPLPSEAMKAVATGQRTDGDAASSSLPSAGQSLPDAGPA